eukprot:4563114-Ditylum_brightwellii.AAC.1
MEGSEPSTFELFLYEAVVAICLASCDAAENTVSDFFTANALYDSFTRTSFDSAYGLASFYRETGDRRKDSVKYAVYNIVSNESTFNIKATHQLKEDGSGDISTSTQMVWKSVLNREFIYADGTSNLPDNLPPLEESGRYRRVAVQPLDVMKPFFVLLSIDLILLITWTVISPSTFVRIQIEGSEDRFGRTNSFNQCLWGNDESKTSYFVLKQLLQIFDLVTIAILAYYAYRSR